MKLQLADLSDWNEAYPLIVHQDGQIEIQALGINSDSDEVELAKRKLVHDSAYYNCFHTAFSYDIDDHVIFFDDKGSIEIIDVKNREFKTSY